YRSVVAVMLRLLHGPVGRVLLTSVLLLSWSGAIPSVLGRQQAARQPAVQPPADNAPDPSKIVEAISSFVKIGAEELRRPGADPSDVPGKARELGFDPQRIFAFVRDRIGYEPYRGVLRGARGALAARAGNSFDKSLLLQSLLLASGQKASLVRGQLPDEKAKSLVDGFLAADPMKGVLGEFVDAPVDVPEGLAQRVGMSPDELRAIVEQSRASVAGFAEEAG